MAIWDYIESHMSKVYDTPANGPFSSLQSFVGEGNTALILAPVIASSILLAFYNWGKYKEEKDNLGNPTQEFRIPNRPSVPNIQ